MYLYKDNLESERVLTRFLTLEDIKIWANFFNDKEALEFLPDYGISSNEERAKHWIDRQLMRYQEKRYGLQALLDKRTNEFIGMCGLIEQNVEGKSEIEVGYHIFKKHWGQGFAPEAAKLFIDFGFRNNLCDSLISIIARGNIKSQRVADKNGLILTKATNWMNIDAYIYRINKEDWILN